MGIIMTRIVVAGILIATSILGCGAGAHKVSVSGAIQETGSNGKERKISVTVELSPRNAADRSAPGDSIEQRDSSSAPGIRLVDSELTKAALFNLIQSYGQRAMQAEDLGLLAIYDRMTRAFRSSAYDQLPGLQDEWEQRYRQLSPK
jgi:hypothetical protein